MDRRRPARLDEAYHTLGLALIAHGERWPQARPRVRRGARPLGSESIAAAAAAAWAVQDHADRAGPSGRSMARPR